MARSPEEILRSLLPDRAGWGRGPSGPGPVGKVSGFLARFRFVFMPLGLFALIAVGVHAAADTLDDRILSVVDFVDAGFDWLASRFTLTEGWVHWIDLDDRTQLARALALLWELAADLVLAIPAFGYRESQQGRPVTGLHTFLGTTQRRWNVVLQDVVRRPTVLRVTRPLSTAAVVIAGGCAIGRMVQGTIYLSQRGWLGDSVAGVLARCLAIAALVGVLLAFGMRAVLRNLQHADQLATERPGRPYPQLIAQGAVGSALVIPLAVAALLDASPLLSFFR